MPSYYIDRGVLLLRFREQWRLENRAAIIAHLESGGLIAEASALGSKSDSL